MGDLLSEGQPLLASRTPNDQRREEFVRPLAADLPDRDSLSAEGPMLSVPFVEPMAKDFLGTGEW